MFKATERAVYRFESASSKFAIDITCNMPLWHYVLKIRDGYLVMIHVY